MQHNYIKERVEGDYKQKTFEKLKPQVRVVHRKQQN